MADDPAHVTLDQETIATLLLRYLALEGVDTIFGVPGGALLWVLDALKDKRKEMSFLVCRQETGAAYAADGYHRATGKLGVVMVTSGPGATNALTGTMNAATDGSALLTVSGEVPISTFGMGYLQEGADSRLDIEGVYRAATGYSAMVTSPLNFHTLLTQALRDALTIPRQGVHLSIPSDLQNQTVGNVLFPTSPGNYRARPRSASREEARRAMTKLCAAKRPLVLVGNGCRFGLDAGRRHKLIELAERYGWPVATTPDAKGVFPEDHKNALRVYGTGGCEWPFYWLTPTLVDPNALPYDALLVLGSKLGGFATNKWDPRLVPKGPIIQVDADASVIARAFPVDTGIVGELGAFVDQLDALAPDFPPDPEQLEARQELIDRIVTTKSPFLDPSARDSARVPMHPAALMKCLEETIPDGSMVFVDAGNCVGWVQHYYVSQRGVDVHSALDMGPMGFAVGAALGAKRGAKDRTVVGVAGDGAFLMHGNEVSTAKAYGIGAIWLVLYDDDLHMVTQGMEEFCPDPSDPTVWEHQYRLGGADLAGFARALGADAYDVKSPEEARDALKAAYAAAREGKPQVVVAHIDLKPIPPYYQKGPTTQGGPGEKK